jgi:hypothetical protein
MTDCEKLRRAFLKLGPRTKRARGKHRARLLAEADRIEHAANTKSCAWAARIDGWKLRKEPW